MSIRANPVAALFPLLLLGLLAGLSYWLEMASRTPVSADDGKSRHDPDYIVGPFVAKRYNTEGLLQHSLTADELRHFPDDDSSEITAPRLTYHRDPSTTVSARSARISSKSEHVQLMGDVRIVRAGAPGKEDSVLTTERLDAWPETEIAQSDHPVTLNQGRSSIQGSGFRMDNTISHFVLEGPVRGTFYRSRREGLAGASLFPRPDSMHMAEKPAAQHPSARSARAQKRTPQKSTPTR